MQNIHHRKLVALIITLAGFLMSIVPFTAHSAQSNDDERAEAEFTVRIINVSNGGTLKTSEGAQTAVPLSPGVWAIHSAPAAIFFANQPDRGEGLEALAEDGNPQPLSQALHFRASVISSGIFNTPIGRDEPAPLGPGDAYVFTFTAQEGDSFSLATMFVQSNDLFYAPNENGIPLFDESGDPLNGEITEYFMLWDAGTEVNQEPGLGEDQAPRQSAPNTGESQSSVVQLVDDPYTYPDVDEVIRVIIAGR